MKSAVHIGIIISILFLLTACSGSDSELTTPEITERQPVNQSNPTQLWDFWDIEIDPSTGAVEMSQLRHANFTANVNQFVDGPPSNLILEIGSILEGPGFIQIAVDVGLKHPFPGLDSYTGFDVLGVFMGTGSATGPDDLSVPGDDDAILLNPDGYTRWFNYWEFSDVVMPLLGYDPGKLGTPGFVPSANLNPYKYYTDGLAGAGDEMAFLQSHADNRGSFTPGTVNYRHYDLRFPTGAGVRFQYAVIAHWIENVNNPGPPDDLDDFPWSANASEALVCDISDNSTLYYVDSSTFGGKAILDITPFDWSATLSGVMEEYEIHCYSDAWTGGFAVPMTPMSSGEYWHTYHVEIDAETLTSDDDLGVWVVVSYPELDYSNEFGIENDAEGALASYFHYDIEVDDEAPVQNLPLNIVSPNGGESWVVATQHNIVWSSTGVTQNIYLEYSKDDFTSDINLIDYDIENNGSYEWTIPDDVSTTVKVRITTMDDEHTDVSDADFSIVDPASPWIEVTAPNGGEEWSVSSEQEITWTSGNTTGEVRLQYSKDDFASDINTISNSTTNDGSYNWIIPDDESDTVKVRVSLVNDPGVYDNSDADFSITGVSYGQWVPIVGQTQRPIVGTYAPDQDNMPLDITVYNSGGASYGEFCQQSGTYPYLTIWFDKWSDNYGTHMSGWRYDMPGLYNFTGPGFDNPPLHKFDTLLNGQYIFVTNVDLNAITWPYPGVSDPMCGGWTGNNNINGNFNGSMLYIYGDAGPSLYSTDPNLEPWYWIVDFSTGVRGGIDDSNGFHLVTYYTSQPSGHSHDGNIWLGHWESPWLLNSGIIGAPTAITGGGAALVNDSAPQTMALAADDDTGLTLYGETEIAGMWVLDTVGKITPHVFCWDTEDVMYWDSSSQITFLQYGTRTPEDIEMIPAKYEGVDVNGYNWIAVLLDNGNNTYSVGVWECDYVGSTEAENVTGINFVQIDITDPIPGNPQALDIDNDDFEIHVVAKYGSTAQVTVFEYIP